MVIDAWDQGRKLEQAKIRRFGRTRKVPAKFFTDLPVLGYYFKVVSPAYFYPYRKQICINIHVGSVTFEPFIITLPASISLRKWDLLSSFFSCLHKSISSNAIRIHHRQGCY
jgi:hypothetical protein